MSCPNVLIQNDSHHTVNNTFVPYTFPIEIIRFVGTFPVEGFASLPTALDVIAIDPRSTIQTETSAP